MKTRTLLIDSSYLLKRSFHGAKNTTTNSFGAIGGLYSFITTVRKLIKKYKSSKIVLVWDGENGGIHRYHIDSQYKANRENKTWNEKIVLSDYEIKREKEKKESILKQRKRIQAYAEELFMRQIEVNNIEADDIIAEYCKINNDKEEIILFTNDRDFLQLLNLNITILFGNIETPITKNNFFLFFDYYYKNSLIIKIICGDVSDNVKGINGIKEKTLIKHFPSLKFKELTVRELCIKANEINEERVKEKKKPLKSLENMLNGVKRLRMNYKLMNLTVPILNDVAVDELEQLEMPLSPEKRGSKNLYKMMNEDEFLTIYKGTFVNYVEPFYSVIMSEKNKLTEYYKKNKNN